MSAPERRPTLADVAAVAGVSAKTVSNVLLSRRYVSATTEDRVRAAIEAVGYQVNPAGRSLASGRSGRIAVVVPMLYQPYFAEVAERLILALAEHGLTSTLRLAWDAQAELDAVTGATTADADGVIICPHFFIGDMLAGVRPTRPTVQLGGSPNPLMDTVLMGEREGFRAVTAHLLDSGRERLALVWNQNSEGAPSGGRFAGFLAAHEERQLRPDEALFGAGSDWDRRASGYEAMVGLLRTGLAFDGVVCVNDATAVGALRALRTAGRRVPEDVALTGFDDTEEGRFTSPSLTSVNPNQEEMVGEAVQMLLERLAGQAHEPRTMRTGAHLVVRASSAPRSD
ncbi:LacI family DNA-binding transcriptional regulator [Ruania albidiflava]|uniref:LacI family DNA-binding transcriptional regulator n=1 Tax=Ruania albidiflava TaxID=366586 RepID=UPI0003B4AD74|nr:LacI family DNA-binding transcriptional regulator [Ruania albidiflava]